MDGSEDLAVGLLQERGNPYTLDAYAGVGTLRTEVHIPTVHRNNSGWYSDIFIYNPNTATAGVTIIFTPIPGVGNAWTYAYSVAPSGSLRINTGILVELGLRFVGSVQVSTNGSTPVAVVATQYSLLNNQFMALSSSQPLAAPLYAPLIQNNNSGWLSGIGLRLPTGNLPFTVNYSTTMGIGCVTETWWNNPQSVYPAPQGNPSACGATPNAVIRSGNGAMAVGINQLQGTSNATTYEAIAVPSMAVSLPKVQRGSSWNDGFVVMNVNESAWINVTVRLYNLDGSLHSTPVNNQALGPRWSLTVLGQIPDPFNGSAQVSASGPVGVVVNNYYPGAGSGDIIGSQPGVHR